MTWSQLAEHYPEFVAWVVQKFGPLPEGPVKEADYNRFKAAYEKELP